MTWWDERSVGPLARENTAKESSSIEAAAATSTTAETLDPDLRDPPRPLLATVDLEDPYLRDLVLEAFGSRKHSWRVERADGIPVEVRREEREKPERAADDCNSSSSDDEDGGGAGAGGGDLEPLFDLLPSPLLSSSRFHWGEYERIDWDRVASGETMASSYAVRKGLTRKAQLAFGLKKWVSKRPASPLAGCFPETFVLQVDHVDYIDEALSDLPEVRDAPEGAARWIVKPSMTNRAAGVAVVDGRRGLTEALQRIPKMREWVVQRYIDRPLLLPRRRRRRRRSHGGESEGRKGEEDGGGGGGGSGGDGSGGGGDCEKVGKDQRDQNLLPPRKWHVRSYALCVGALKVYSFGGMLALTAISGYEGAALDDLDAHLTNTCRKREEKEEGKEGRGKSDENGADDGGAGGDGDDDDERILLLSEVPALLSQEGTSNSSLTLSEATAKTKHLASRISTLVGETFAAVSSELTFFALPSAFELFGFDFLVDEDWTPWLLEANADPDVGASGGRLKEVIRGMVEGVLRLTADELVEGEESEGKVASATSSSSAAAAEAKSTGEKNDDDDVDDDDDDDDEDPLAPVWKLVFERDSGREGSGFRVG